MTRREGQGFEYTECFVAFIDVLGFSAAVEKSCGDPGLLERLVSATSFAPNMTGATKESRRENPDGTVEIQRWEIQIRSFSDSVVIFMPVETGSIAQVLFLVRYLHDRLLEQKLCMRGAVTIGGMYWDEAWGNLPPMADVPEGSVLFDRHARPPSAITIGPGMIEAYRLENEQADNPRVLLSDSLVDYLKRENVRCLPLGPYQPPDRPMTDFVRQDHDDLHHLDLLHPDVMRRDTEKIVQLQEGQSFTVTWERDECNQASVLALVNELCDTYLGVVQGSDKVRRKYQWLKDYANDPTR
ncbi:hypothetical protein OT109_09405 [Phycisphaeraceae bacterium D3-23]